MAPGRLVDRDAIAGELRELAAHPGLATRGDELRALGLALSGRGDLDPWAEIDLVRGFVRPESVRAAVAPRPEHRVWAWIEVVLGALVFVPLLVTWFGLMQATSAYQALVGSDPAQAARPFLQLWQSGFEGRLAGWATFGHVALYATAVIAVLLVLSVVHGLRRAGADRREEHAAQEAEDLLARLAPLLTRTQLVLHERRRASPQRFAAELTGAAQMLEALVKQAADTQRDLGDAARLVEQSVAGAKDRLADVAGAVAPLQQAVGGVERAVRDGSTQLSETVRANAAATDSLVHRSGQRASDAAESVKQATERVGDGLDRAGERVEDAVRDLAAAQRGFTTGAEVVADVTGQILGRLAELDVRVAELARQVADASGATLAAAERLDRNSAQLLARVAGVVPETGVVADAVADAAVGGPPQDAIAPARPRPAERQAGPAQQSLLDLDEIPVRQAGR